MSKLLRRIRPPGMRIQLTLWFIAVFSVLMLLFGAIFYINLRASLQTSFDTSLQLRTQQIAAGINEDRGTITIHDVTGALPGITDPDAVTDNATPKSNPQSSSTTTATPSTPVKTNEDVKSGSVGANFEYSGRCCLCYTSLSCFEYPAVQRDTTSAW